MNQFKFLSLRRMVPAALMVLLLACVAAFAVPACAEDCSLRLFAFTDKNLDGIQDKKEGPIGGVRFGLMADGVTVCEAVTDEEGNACLMAPAGTYRLYAECPEGYGVVMLGEDRSFAGTVLRAEGNAELPAADTVLCAVTSVGGLSGKVFEDVNGDGLLGKEDIPVAGVTVHAVGKKSGVEALAVSDENGDYCLILPVKGKYIVTADIPEGMLYTRYSKTGGDLRSIFSRSTVSREFSVADKIITNKNIGIVQQGAIYGTAFMDLNYNGIRDEDEPAVKGVTVEVIKVSNQTSCGKTVTDKQGYFCIENLRSGDYRLRAVLPEDGSIFSLALDGDAAQVNRFEQKGSRRESSVEPLTVSSGAQVQALIGVARGASISGTVFTDSDYSGARNGKEKALSGIKVRAIDKDGNIVAQDTTGTKGNYVLSGILPGEYRVEFQRKAGYGFTRCRNEEKGGSHVRTLEEGWGVCEYLTLSMGEEVTDVNAGMLPSATVKGSLIHDSNDNGSADAGEVGLAGAKVRLWSIEAEMDFTVSCAEDGSFSFDGVMPGSYNLEYILPKHCEMTRGSLLEENIVKVQAGESYTLDTACAVELGSYEGFVWDSAGQGIPNAVIKLGGVSAKSREDGSFSITGLRPGEYELVIKLPGEYIFARATDGDGIPCPCSSNMKVALPWEALVNRSEKLVEAVKPARIAGEIWMDENKDGQRSPEEWVMEGLTVELCDEANDGETVAEMTSTNSGYCFDKVRPGSYTLRFALPEASSPAGETDTRFKQDVEGYMVLGNISVNEGDSVDGLNVGLVSTTSIGGTVTLSEGGATSPVAGARIQLLLDGKEQASATTSEDGSYRFDGLWPGNYTLNVTLPYGTIFVKDGDSAFAADATVVHADSGSTASSPEFALEMGKHRLDMNVLCIKPAMIGDIAWLDENANGLLDGSEKRIPGITVQLYQGNTLCYETTTDAYGYYLFSGVYPGEYVLQAKAYEELTPTTPIPSLRIISGCLTEGDGLLARSDAFIAVSGSKDMNFDLGYTLLPGCEVPEEILVEAPGKDWTAVNEAERVILTEKED